MITLPFCVSKIKSSFKYSTCWKHEKRCPLNTFFVWGGGRHEEGLQSIIRWHPPKYSPDFAYALSTPNRLHLFASSTGLRGMLESGTGSDGAQHHHAPIDGAVHARQRSHGQEKQEIHPLDLLIRFRAARFPSGRIWLAGDRGLEPEPGPEFRMVGNADFSVFNVFAGISSGRYTPSNRRLCA